MSFSADRLAGAIESPFWKWFEAEADKKLRLIEQELLAGKEVSYEHYLALQGLHKGISEMIALPKRHIRNENLKRTETS